MTNEEFHEVLRSQGYEASGSRSWYRELPSEEGGHGISFERLSAGLFDHTWCCQVNTNSESRNGVLPTCCVIHFNPADTTDVKGLEARLLAGLAAMEAR